MKNIRGQSLFELLLAIGVVALIIVAVVSATSVSIRNNGFSRNRAVATEYSQESIEWLRGQRDAGWSQFLANSGLGSNSSASYCFNSSPPGGWPATTASANCLDSVISGTIYGRKVTLTCYSNLNLNLAIACNGALVDTVKAMAVTTWPDNIGTHTASTTTFFSNWQQAGISAPLPTATPVPGTILSLAWSPGYPAYNSSGLPKAYLKVILTDNFGSPVDGAIVFITGGFSIGTPLTGLGGGVYGGASPGGCLTIAISGQTTFTITASKAGYTNTPSVSGFTLNNVGACP